MRIFPAESLLYEGLSNGQLRITTIRGGDSKGLLQCSPGDFRVPKALTGLVLVLCNKFLLRSFMN